MTVWSLGTLLYVLLLGDIPYETTDHIIHNKPKKVTGVNNYQIPDITGAIFTLSLSIRILNSQCVEEFSNP